MPRYVLSFSYTSDTWAQMTGNPGDRAAAVRAVIESLNGSLECLYRMLGAQDRIGIAQLPDSAHAAALSAMITSTGTFKTVQTHELLHPGAARPFGSHAFRRMWHMPAQGPERFRKLSVFAARFGAVLPPVACSLPPECSYGADRNQR